MHRSCSPCSLLVLVLMLCAAGVPGLRGQAATPQSWDAARTPDERAAFVAAVCASESELARRKALELWNRPGDPDLRLRLLRHAAPLQDVSAEMLRVAETGRTAAERFVGSLWFLERHGTDGLEAMRVLAAEKALPMLTRAVAASMAASELEEAHDAFEERYPQLGYEDQVVVMQLLRGADSRFVERFRKGQARRGSGLLQAEALAQQIEAGEVQAVRKARQLIRRKPDTKTRARLFDALLGYARPSDLEICARVFELPDVRTLDVLRARLPELAAREDVRKWVEESGLEHRDSKVRRFACRILMAMEGEFVLAQLERLALGEEDALRREALLSLAERGSGLAGKIAAELIRRDDTNARLDALEVFLRGAPLLEGAGDAVNNGVGKRILAIARDSTGPEQVLAIDVAAEKKLAGLGDKIGSFLSARDWRLRSAAYHYAASVRRAESVPLLIEALGQESGRLEQECRVALDSLTRLWFQEPARWKQWWRDAEANFVLPPPPPEKKEERKEPEGAGGTKAAFYGIPVYSTRVLYCLDVSGSMNEPVGTGVTRMDIAKRALKAALEKAPAGSEVNVLFFDTDVHVFSKRLVDLSRERERKKLFAFIDESAPLGGTNLEGVLSAALEQQEADTIFLLSDGDPSVGAILDPLELARHVLQRNRTQRLRIHGVSVGQESVLLRELAKATGGEYVERL